MEVGDFLAKYQAVISDEKLLLSTYLDGVDSRLIAEVVARDRYKPSSIDDVWAFEGCALIEIEEVRTLWGGWLPGSLEAFLILMGRSQAYVDVQFGLSYSMILAAPDAVRDWLDEVAAIGPKWFGNGDRFRIPEEARHLGHRNGSRFFFVVDQGVDPIVYQMLEGDGSASGVKSTDLTIGDFIEAGLFVPRRYVERSINRILEGS